MTEAIRRTRITDRIYYLEPGNNGDNTCCAGIMVNGSPKVFFDANMGREQTKALLREEKPELAFVSHFHLDHSAWAGLVQEQAQTELFIPAGEEPYFTSHDFFVQNTAGPFGLSDLWREVSLKMFGYTEVRDFSRYDGSFSLRINGLKMEFTAAPGHSRGHMGVYFPQERILFTSDLGLNRFGPWYGWPDSDMVQYIDSILTLKALKPRLLLTSHEGVIRKDIDAVFDRCLQAFFIREESVKQRIEAGWSKQDIVEDGIYFTSKDKVREPMRTFLVMWDAYMFDHHLAKLEEGGLSRDFPGLCSSLEV